MEINQTVGEIQHFKKNSNMATATILDFQKFKILSQLNTHHHAKFCQNRSNGCEDIAI